MNKYKIKYIASPISEVIKSKTISAKSMVLAIRVLEIEVGKNLEEIISAELI